MLLAYLSVALATDAVRGEVEDRLSGTASISARLVDREMGSLRELVDSYAKRPNLQHAVTSSGSGHGKRARIRFHLEQLQRSRDGIYTTFLADSSGKLIDITPATPRIVGKDFSFRDWYAGVRRTGRAYVSEAYQTQAGDRPLVVAGAAPVRDPKTGKVVAILVAAYGLEYLQRFTDELPSGDGAKVKVTDQRGVLVAASGEPLTDLVSRRSDPRVRAALRGDAGVVELETPDGRRLSAYAPVPGTGWTVTASVPANAALAAIAKMRSTVFAITALLTLVLAGGLAFLAWVLVARKRAEDALTSQNERLRELDTMKDEFVATVSHELRTPVSSIIAYLEPLLDEEPGPLTEEQRSFLVVVERSAQRLARQVEDLLLLAQIEARKVELSRVSLNLADVAEECVEAARARAEKHGILLSLSREPVVPLLGDPSRLAQVLDNLVGNAIKFTEHGGRIDVRVASQDGHALLTVSDTGIGISASEQDRLFERFFRTASATAASIQGTGLGLTISKAIVDAHGGRIDIESAEGVGTTFRVELPLAAGGTESTLDKEAA